MNIQQPTLRQGSVSAAEIYLSVGLALSWWEASEDIIMGAYSAFCTKKEPLAYKAYVAANRSGRSRMWKAAFLQYPDVYTKDEQEILKRTMNELNAMAQMRNQIAHGHVTKTSQTVNGVLKMDGHFLVPSLNENGDIIARDFRYAHTAQEIDIWRDKVREQRAKIMDLSLGVISHVMNADQEKN